MSDEQQQQSENTVDEPRGLDAQAESEAVLSVKDVEDAVVWTHKSPFEVIEQPTDEEILLDGAGDEDFLRHALQFRGRPELYFGDVNFLRYSIIDFSVITPLYLFACSPSLKITIVGKRVT